MHDINSKASIYGRDELVKTDPIKFQV